MVTELKCNSLEKNYLATLGKANENSEHSLKIRIQVVIYLILQFKGYFIRNKYVF